MKYTNKLNLPKVFERLNQSRELIPNRYSVTELLLSTQEIILTRKYYSEIEEDISDCIPALFGSAVHKVFEENSNPEESEVKLEYQFGEDTIVGIIDHVKDDLIEDYKTCSVSKITKQDFSEHELQIKLYAFLRFKKTGIITRKGTLYYLMKDWSKVKASTGGNYPNSPIYIHSFEIQDSDYDLAENYLTKKLSEIHHYLNVKDEELLSCSDEERWYTGTDYAVYKNVGDKRAAYVTKDEEDAHNYITNKCNGSGEVQVRKGQNLKCELYCLVNKFCKQFKS